MWLLIFASSQSALARDQTQKQVLAFHAMRREQRAAIVVDGYIQKILNEGLNGRLDYYTEYIDVARFPDPEFQKALLEFLHHKYAGKQFDLILTTGEMCTEFLRENSAALFPGTPVVFVTGENPKPFPNATGFSSRIDFESTLELALKLQPGTRTVYLVSGASEYDKYYQRAAEQQLQRFTNRVSLISLQGLPISDLLKTVSTLPPNSIIYVLSQSQDGTGNKFIPMEALDEISAVANAPIYAWIDTCMDHGVIGGNLLNLEKLSTQIAGLGLRVLEGETAENISVGTLDANIPMFDWRQLQRWGISEKHLPAGSIVQFKKPTFWEQYKWRVSAIISLSLLEALLIVWLLINRARRRRAEEAKVKLAAIVESSDDAILSKTAEGIITSWNAGAEKMYGYAPGEVIGKHVSILAPPERKLEIQEILEQIKQGKGVDHMETVRVTKDGRRLEVSLTVSLIKDDHGHILGGSTIARDITSRKNNQHALQQLTGRLLMLQDEERRRVAAELHDSLGQSLAIIKNRAKVGLRAPIDQDRVTEQLEEIAETATSAILEVREIAHNLRPYELDRLGLGVAIESMVERVSDTTPIELSTELDQIDGLLSTEAETSVYRIVQEGLNNVLKHSHASTARIVIARTGNELEISIQDNGKGMSKQRSEHGNGTRGFGLTGMAERVRVLDGSLTINSQPEIGTTLTIRLELPHAA